MMMSLLKPSIKGRLQDMEIGTALASSNMVHEEEMLHLLQKLSPGCKKKTRVYVKRKFFHDLGKSVGRHAYENTNSRQSVCS